MAINNGGPAFPQIYVDEPTPHRGMSLRDYFAGQAMAGIPRVLQIGAGQTVETSVDAAAEFAYRIADAMLAEREKAR